MVDAKKSTSFKIQDSVSGRKKSSFAKYMEMVVGSTSFLDLIKFELIVLLVSRLPGALGLLLRKKLYPLILGKVGSGVVFGTNISFRHPGKIRIGDNVILDDNLLIDAKGESNTGIEIGNEVFVGRNTILSCKDGDIHLHDRVNVGFNCEIFSSTLVDIGQDTLIAAYSYIVGGGNYKLDELEKPINQQYDYEGKGGIVLEENVWLGAHCMILDGVKIGKGSVIAAGAVVTKPVESYKILSGIPARVIKERT